MGLNLSIFLVILLVTSPIFAQDQDVDAVQAAPGMSPAQAEAQGIANADALAAGTANTRTNGMGTLNTNQNSMHSASVDNMLNSRQAETVASIISAELQTAADASMQSCSSTDSLSDPDCYMSSALAGMHTLTQNSSASFRGAGDTAWYNVCRFSAISCDQAPPNPYASLIPQNSQDIAEVIEELQERGFSVDRQTGVVRLRNGRVINPSQEKSLQKALGDNSTQKLLQKIKSIERSALKRLNAITRKQALQALGLAPKSGAATQLNPLAGISSGRSGSNEFGRSKKTDPEVLRYPASQEGYDDGSEMGMITSYRGEPVGVSNDSLFRMVKYRYQIKSAQKSFMSP